MLLLSIYRCSMGIFGSSEIGEVQSLYALDEIKIKRSSSRGYSKSKFLAAMIHNIVFPIEDFLFVLKPDIFDDSDKAVIQRMMNYPAWDHYITGKATEEEFVRAIDDGSAGIETIRHILTQRREALEPNHTVVQLLTNLQSLEERESYKLCALASKLSREDIAYLRDKYASFLDFFDATVCSCYMDTSDLSALLDFASFCSGASADETLLIVNERDKKMADELGGARVYLFNEPIPNDSRNEQDSTRANEITSQILAAIESSQDLSGSDESSVYSSAHSSDSHGTNDVFFQDTYQRMLDAENVDNGYHAIYKVNDLRDEVESVPRYIDGDIFSEALMLENDPVYALSARGWPILKDMASRVTKENGTSNFFTSLELYGNDMDTSSTVLRVLQKYRMLKDRTWLSKFAISAVSNVDEDGRMLVFYNAPEKPRIDPVVNAAALRFVLLSNKILNSGTDKDAAHSHLNTTSLFIENQAKLVEEAVHDDDYVKYYSCRLFALVFIMDLYCEFPDAFSKDFGVVLRNEFSRVLQSEEIRYPVLEGASKILITFLIQEEAKLFQNCDSIDSNKQKNLLFEFERDLKTALASSGQDYWKREAVYQKTTNESSYFGAQKHNVHVHDGLIDSYVVKALRKIRMFQWKG